MHIFDDHTAVLLLMFLLHMLLVIVFYGLLCACPSSFMLFFFLMIRRPPRSTLDRSSAASDVYKRQDQGHLVGAGQVAGHQGLDAGGDAVEQAGPGVEAQGVKDSGEEEGFHGAVSYTHLRAHETVLDLVCRLLLEKQNKKRN